MGQCKRRFPRLTVRVRVEYEAPDGTRRDLATTLGAGGLFIESESPPLAGVCMKLWFQVQKGGQRHAMEGRVVWADPTGIHSHKPGFGVQFTNSGGSAILARELEYLDLPPAR